MVQYTIERNCATWFPELPAGASLPLYEFTPNGPAHQEPLILVFDEMKMDGGGKKFRSQKQIVIVRNPIDALPSMAYMGMTGSNSVLPNEKLHEDFPEFWDGFLKFMAP